MKKALVAHANPFKKALATWEAPIKPIAKPAPPPEPIFAAIFSDVRRLKPDNRYHHTPPSPPAWPHTSKVAPHQEQDPHSVISGWFELEDTPDQFIRSGQQKSVLKKLRSGTWPVVAEIDLHGIDRYVAQEKLCTLIWRAQAIGQCVRVIHGRGFGSQNGEPVLKSVVRNCLLQHPDVQAFCEAPPQHGGEGALLVLIRRRADSADFP